MPNLDPFYDTFLWVLKSTWPMLVLFIVILIILRITKIIINKERLVFYTDFYRLLFILYILLLYYMLISMESTSYGSNFIPFKEIFRYSFMSKGFIYNVLGNIALFMPFGYFVSDYLKANKIRHIFITSFLISLTAELIQYKIGRTFDVDDILLNVLGAILGYLAYRLIQKVKDIMPNFLKNEIFYNVLAFIVFGIIAFVLGRMWGSV
jgi:glycopeptide antibiotics resistance protein